MSKRINNISNIKIDIDKTLEDEKEIIKEELPKLDSRDGFFPDIFPFSKIEFLLYLPFRLQAEMYDIEEKFLNTYTEKFLVSINYYVDFPVTIIEPTSPIKTSDASKAVSMIWHFLE